MSPVGFEPTIPESARPQTYALDRMATGIGTNISAALELKLWNQKLQDTNFKLMHSLPYNYKLIRIIYNTVPYYLSVYRI
jgi:hypothetical protein